MVTSVAKITPRIFNMTGQIVVFSTCASAEDAARIARHLVDARVAACVTILPGARSVYRWEGRIEDTAEHVLLIKSSRAVFPALRAAIERVHPYQVPEIIALPVVDGAANYLAWLAAETSAETSA